MSERIPKRYTGVDYALLGVVAVAFGIVFFAAWPIYYAVKAVGGPVLAKLLTYGIWFMAAPLAASLIRKPLSGFLGETLAALIETIIPNAGGVTNLIYGLAQGAASEIAYLLFRYRKWGVAQGALSGALAAFPALALDVLLWGDIATPEVMAIWLAGALVSGAIYGSVAALIGKSLR